MADSNEQENQANTAPSDELVAAPEDNKKPTKKCGNAGSKLAQVIAISALALAGYNQYASQQVNNGLVQKNQALEAQIQAIQEEQTERTQELNQQSTQLKNERQDLDSKLQNLSQQVQAMHQKGNQSQDWLLLKARYYLELAQINAHWPNVGDDQATAALLQQADLILAQMKAADLFKIRQVIADELQQLKTAKQLDLPGLLSQLDAIQSNISALRLEKNLKLQTESTTDKEQTATAAVSNWRAQLNASLDKLSKLVVIRRNDEDLAPLISPAYEALLKESLYLSIQEAQWALLNQNPKAYQLAIKQALTTLERGFNKQVRDSSALIKQLQDLEKIQLVAEKIEVGQALPLLNELIEERQISTPKKVKQGGQEE